MDLLVRPITVYNSGVIELNLVLSIHKYVCKTINVTQL